MKVLHLLSNPGIGGTETFLLNIVPVMRTMGVDASVANLWKDGGDIGPLMQEKEIPFISLGSDQHRFQWDGARRLRQLLRDEKYDIVCAYGFRMSLLLRLVGQIKPRPVLMTGLRGLMTWVKWYHVLSDRLTQGAIDCFIGNSQAVCQQRRQREKTASNKIKCIVNGIDLEHFRSEAQVWPSREALGLPEGILGVTVANFRLPKGHSFLLDVIAACNNLPDDAKFVWVGMGPDEEALIAKAKQLGIRDRIIFYGQVVDVRPLLANCDLFILPSSEEGMPRALMEAMVMGLSSISTSVGGCPEVLRDGIDGYLVTFGQVEEAAGKIQHLFNDQKLREQFGQNAICQIHENFDMNDIARQYLDVYQEWISKTK